MINKTKADRIHDQMPRYFKTRVNPNWKALIETIGESDQNLADLVEEVRKQFFVKTASRPYLDRLGANFLVSRPKLIGMDDPTFRQYIPILAYQPKQVKLVFDLLLNLFFFRQTTTAFTQSESAEPFTLLDGWELQYTIDQIYNETIIFNTAEFADISNATAEEIVSAINRQATNSFAIVYNDRILKKNVVQIFSNTIGSKGSVQVIGGRADIALRFSGFNDAAGSGSNTVWNVTKIGDTVTFQQTGGVSANLNTVQVGDTVISSIAGNEGSFVITAVDLSNDSFSFINLFATPGTFNHSLLPTTSVIRFMTSEKMVVYLNDSRAIVWEVSPGEIIVEMPATPPVVKRSLIGSAHLNGVVDTIVDMPTSTSLTLDDASIWPISGEFVIQPLNEIQTHILTGSEDVVIDNQFNTRFDISQIFTYTSKSGNTLSGITPNLPIKSALYEANITTAVRVGDVVTINTSTPNGFNVGEGVSIQNVTPDTDGTLNGTFVIQSILGPNSFTYTSLGVPATSSGGVSRVERIGIANSGSLAYLTSAKINSGIFGPYMWDSNALFVLSSLTSTLQNAINAGNNALSIVIDPVNNIPNAQGFVIFDFGTERQEGPVRYLYKPTASLIQIDPAYIFKFNHDIGSSITVIRSRGSHVMSGIGTEYPAYITDPGVARTTLETLMLQVKSVGIFIEFLIRYPKQLYSSLDVYGSGDPDLWPIQ